MWFLQYCRLFRIPLFEKKGRDVKLRWLEITKLWRHKIVELRRQKVMVSGRGISPPKPLSDPPDENWSRGKVMARISNFHWESKTKHYVVKEKKIRSISFFLPSRFCFEICEISRLFFSPSFFLFLSFSLRIKLCGLRVFNFPTLRSLPLFFLHSSLAPGLAASISPHSVALSPSLIKTYLFLPGSCSFTLHLCHPQLLPPLQLSPVSPTPTPYLRLFLFLVSLIFRSL